MKILWQGFIRWVEISLVFDWHDLWIGVRWEKEDIYDDDDGGMWHDYSVYVALLPTLFIRFLWDVKAEKISR